MKTALVLALVLAAGVGCHSRPSRERGPTWQRTSEAAEPFEGARAACKSEAMRKTADVQGEGLASKAAVGIYTDCMRRRGWTPVRDEGGM